MEALEAAGRGTDTGGDRVSRHASNTLLILPIIYVYTSYDSNNYIIRGGDAMATTATTHTH